MKESGGGDVKRDAVRFVEEVADAFAKLSLEATRWASLLTPGPVSEWAAAQKPLDLSPDGEICRFAAGVPSRAASVPREVLPLTVGVDPILALPKAVAETVLTLPECEATFASGEAQIRADRMSAEYREKLYDATSALLRGGTLYALYGCILEERLLYLGKGKSDESSKAMRTLQQESQGVAFNAWRNWLANSKKKPLATMRLRHDQFLGWLDSDGWRHRANIGTVSLGRFETLWESYERRMARARNASKRRLGLSP